PAQSADKDMVFDLDLDDLVHPDFGRSNSTTSPGTTPEPPSSSSDSAVLLPSSPFAATLPENKPDENDHETYMTERLDFVMEPIDSPQPRLPALPSRLVQTGLPYRCISPSAYATQERAQSANFQEEGRVE
ncbi:hypothetical protein FRC09_015891, partial [Ceratobasidium sp. 395]